MAGPQGELRAVFCEALEHNVSQQRADYLDGACRDRPELRIRVEELLRAHEEASGFLRETNLGSQSTIDEPTRCGVPRTVIDRYEIREQIGEGGFGLVFLAEQHEPVRRQVAVKVLKPGMDTRQVLARFEAERQALALMDHANIARVLDAGETSEGRPYFAMELVRGVPITVYCDQNHLGARERLALFVTVCQAVQHAHHKGIIHRDIKPSNVLVTTSEGEPVVKVIDFGLAKALGQQLTDKTLNTGCGQMIGTPLYMSPEQAQTDGRDVDTRTDVYSLGVLLYELLTGTTPFEKERLRDVGHDEMRRIIREEEPVRPSARLRKDEGGRMKDQKKTPAHLFSSFILHPSSFQELDWIVMKALEKDRGRRYETASAFAADVQRYLHDETVSACPPSAWYRIRKITRRNRVALTMAGVVASALVGMVAVLAGSIGWVVRDRETQRAQARQEQEDRQQAADHQIEGALDEWLRWRGAESWLEAAAAVKRAEGFLAGGGSKDLRRRVSRARKDVDLVLRIEEIRLEQTAVKEDHFARASTHPLYLKAFADYGIDVQRLIVAEAADQVKNSDIRQQLVVALDDWGITQARDSPPARKILDVAQAADWDDWRRTARDLWRGGKSAQLRDLATRPEALKQPPGTLILIANMLSADNVPSALALLKQAHLRHPDDFWINHYSGSYHDSPQERLRFFQAALAARPQSPGANLNVGLLLKRQGRHDDAIDYYRRAIVLKPDYVSAHVAKGEARLQQGQVDEAEAAFRKALQLKPDSAHGHGGLAQAAIKRGQWDRAIAEFTQAITLDRKFAVAWHGRGWVRSQMKEWDKAIADYTEALALDRRFAKAWHHRGFAWTRLKQWDKAIADFTQAIALDPKDVDSWHNRGRMFVELKQWNKAIADFTQAIALDPKKAKAWHNRGCVCLDLEKWDQAIADFTQAITLNPSYVLALHNRSRVLAQLGQWDRAATDMGRVVELIPRDSGQWMKFAVFRLQSGNITGYRAACAGMIERFGKTTNPGIALQVALSCVLSPSAVRDPKMPVRLAELAVKSEPKNPWCLIARGAALYRDGQTKLSAEQLRLIPKTWPEDPYAVAGMDGAPVLTWLLLALAEHGVGKHEEARRWLDKAVEKMDQETAAKPIGALRRQSEIWAMCLVLRREAEGKLKSASGKKGRTTGAAARETEHGYLEPASDRLSPEEMNHHVHQIQIPIVGSFPAEFPAPAGNA